MIKTILFFILLFVFSHSTEVDLGRLYFYEHNSIIDTTLRESVFVVYETEDNDIYLIKDDIEGRVIVLISDISIVLSNINKYIEWNSKAISKNVSLEKTISFINLQIVFSFGEEYHASKEVNRAEFKFLSQSNKRHFLCIIFPNVISKKNRFLSKKVETMYFDINQAITFKKMLSSHKIKLMIDAHNKKNKIAEGFN
jgi:hypothetical protein